jgi:two-component system sensor histidine kinase BaeS
VALRDDGRDVVLTVADTGRGIAAEHLTHLGERFYRADPVRNSADGGVGLGLAICREIVSRHGGTMAVHSRPETGTQVVVRFPRVSLPAPTGSDCDVEVRPLEEFTTTVAPTSSD